MTTVPWVLVFVHSNAMLVGHVNNLLEAAGIRCELRNMTLAGGAGELPPLECEPQVWVAAHNQQRAEQVIRDALDASEAKPEWQCRRCGERLEGAFDTCWNCGAEREEG
ncbi:DUF2007 domain-containing protein [Halomonas huangheensis]|uniref:DUF2007 domain-containing protein n=1 Tax=Halomonas huangheensis TaxID=1178482 RepID=W1N3K7_9GAMM|nr:DUF2007 domain-containing protein [Halomonas huangheensis]ALM51317.1 hypothetical protein AR456_02660 [Halomonas huangheensis]ERL49746.1 hypothetical protein BJB45_01105 [Halomonas huangheensis]